MGTTVFFFFFLYYYSIYFPKYVGCVIIFSFKTHNDDKDRSSGYLMEGNELRTGRSFDTEYDLTKEGLGFWGQV